MFSPFLYTAVAAVFASTAGAVPTLLPTLSLALALTVRASRYFGIAKTETIDATGDIITPGFIDTHRHGWQTAFKTLGPNTSLAEGLERYGEFAVDGGYSGDDVYITILDHAHYTWSNETVDVGFRASIDSGARIFWSYAFHNVTGFPFDEQVKKFKDIAESDVFDGKATGIKLPRESA
ncbi:hypothetical protein BBP40_010907 [Aspergillus hancockii]|nr:hypothetical protein BBP40_010907 [Aspergillus hancockii]